MRTIFLFFETPVCAIFLEAVWSLSAFGAQLLVVAGTASPFLFGVDGIERPIGPARR
jgi:hypothetical protein